MSEEKPSILPKSIYYGIVRDEVNCTRHEICEGPNRQKAIEDRLYIFIPSELHNINKICFQHDTEVSEYMWWVGMNAWCKHYKKEPKDFRAIYYRYGIEPTKLPSEIFKELYKGYEWVIQHNIRENRYRR